MVQCPALSLDRSFAALADETRRGMIAVLGDGPASVTVLAERFRMTLTGARKHLAVLEQAGLITTETSGRVRTCRLRPGALAAETEWLRAQQRLFEARFDALDRLLTTMKQEDDDGPAGDGRSDDGADGCAADR